MTISSKKQMECPICGLKFISNKTGNLKRHLKLHEPYEVRYKCNQCERDYQTQGNFKTHVEVHHLNNDAITFEMITKHTKGYISLYTI